MNRFFHSVIMPLSAGILLCGGCGNGNTEESLWQQLREQGNQKSELAVRVETLDHENQQLTRQISTLQGIDPNERLSVIDTLEKIAITSRSGFYDKDNDGKKESLVVYLETTDSAGDRVKAAGRVEVQLWNLNSKNSDTALVKEWTIEPKQLKQTWAGTLMNDYYRFTFPVEDIALTDTDSMTIKVKFVDYVSGKVFQDQRPIK